MKKKVGIIVSPIIIIAIGFIIASFSSLIMNDWAIIPLAIIYWSLSLFYSFRFKRQSLRAYFSKPKGSTAWFILALVVGSLPIFILIRNITILNNPIVLITWLIFALINPFIEEIYWRGVLVDNLPFRGKWASVGYSTLLFVASKPLMWGVFSVAGRSLTILLPLGIMAIVWSIVYIKTKSLWWSITSHFLVDIFALTGVMLLNLYMPPII